MIRTCLCFVGFFIKWLLIKTLFDHKNMAPLQQSNVDETKSNGVKAVLLGPPGAGKGTQVII